MFGTDASIVYIPLMAIATLRIAGIVPESIVDGPGFRFAVFTQGCPHHCPGCHNPQTHDPAGGRSISLLDLMRQIWQIRTHLDGVTFSGGDPFCQPFPLYHLARWCHRLGLHVMAYSGWTFEQLQEKPECHNLLNEIDALVDGRFVLAKKSLDLRFRGSSNQRFIHLSHGKIIAIE